MSGRPAPGRRIRSVAVRPRANSRRPSRMVFRANPVAAETTASPPKRSGASWRWGVRRGHHRWHAGGRRARHARSALAVDQAVELVLRQPGHELASGAWRGLSAALGAQRLSPATTTRPPVAVEHRACDTRATRARCLVRGKRRWTVRATRPWRTQMRQSTA